MEEKLNQMAVDIAVIKTKLNDLTEGVCEKVGDHESRLRRLESFKYKLVGAIIFGNVFAAVISGYIVTLFTKAH